MHHLFSMMIETMKWRARVVVAGAALVASAGCDQAKPREAAAAVQQAAASSTDEKLYRDIARSSWSYLDRYYQPATGFVNATPDWFNTTLWDLGGQLLATHAAKELGLLSKDEYEKRTNRTLATLESVKLTDGIAFNRIYSTKDGTPNESGAGWSATDLGRFLLALKILSVREPQFAARLERIARRNDFTRLARGGYLYGRAAGKTGPADFQEGRIGYEQYVAAGFSQWGADVRNAQQLRKNAKPVKVMGVQLLADSRGFDRLLSEPFILYGLELGLSGEMRTLAQGLLRAQEARYRATGQVTIVSEDALTVKPHYFYYYCVYCNAKPFVIGISSPKQTFDEPRWVSTKGAFGWHALMPDEYTAKAVEYVSPARDATRGWATGVFEKTRESTRTFDVNTAVVMMEIAYYQLRGRRPLMEAAQVQAGF